MCVCIWVEVEEIGKWKRMGMLVYTSKESVNGKRVAFWDSNLCGFVFCQKKRLCFAVDQFHISSILRLMLISGFFVIIIYYYLSSSQYNMLQLRYS